MRKSIVLIGLIVALAGCVAPRQMALLQGNNPQSTIVDLPAFQIAMGDRLQIVFSAQNPEAIAPYNSAGERFLVNADGQVTIPVIGDVELAGKTVKQAQDTLQQMVRQQVQNAIVQVTITNATITILGEVNHPASIAIVQPVPLLQIIGQAGGFTRNANCKSVMVQRQENGQMHRYHVNLLTDELYTSPCYYVQKGDVVVVTPLLPVSIR